jgi:LuxR family quorum sensing-dependent transcriptional regulator
MGVAGPRRAFDFVDRLAGLGSAETVIEAFRDEAEHFGCSAFALGELPRTGSRGIPPFFVSTWPSRWLEVYFGEYFAVGDPTVEHARAAVLPATFSDLRRRQQAAGGSIKVFEAAAAHGWPEGLSIPVHGPNGYSGIVALAAETRELSPPDRAALHLMALYLHERLKELMAPAPSPDRPRLSRGEIECLQWLVAGKSDWEMGEILGISEATAHWRIEKAKKKLGVKTRAQIAALAIKHGYVTL